MTLESLTIWLLPPGLSIALAAAGLLVWWRSGWSRALLALAGATLVLTALPAVGWLMALPMQRALAAVPADAADRAPAAEAVVVFTGGIFDDGVAGWWPGDETIRRTSAGLQFAEVRGLPLILVGGAPEPGTPSEAEVTARRMDLHRRPASGPRVHVIGLGADTASSAPPAAQALREAGLNRVVVATSFAHGLRAAAALRGEGVEVLGRVPDSEQPELGIDSLLPSGRGLRVSHVAAYELLAIAWYLVTGRVELDDLSAS